MIKNGARPTRRSHLDRDLHKSFGNALGDVTFPTEFFVTKDPNRPDQNADGESEGCTNYTQWRLASNLGKTGITPAQLEAVTHANALGGSDIRTSILACLPASSAHPERLGWFTNFYNIQAKGIIDWFDAFRLAQVSGLPEQRSLSWGTPWFPSWENAINGVLMTRQPDGTYTLLANPAGKQVVMPMPTDDELASLKKESGLFGLFRRLGFGSSMSWHNSELDGWTLAHGPLTYRDESWQGPNIGEGGFVFFPREVINTVMTISGTVAYTGTNQIPQNPQTVDMTAVGWIVSLILSLLAKL